MKKINLRTKFGIRLCALREQAGLSQEAFADKCGYARSYAGADGQPLVDSQ